MTLNYVGQFAAATTALLAYAILNLAETLKIASGALQLELNPTLNPPSRVGLVNPDPNPDLTVYT